MVGLTELESVTSCVSSRRSNQLSYKPIMLRELALTGLNSPDKLATVSR
jgi:hypothetical protein